MPPRRPSSQSFVDRHGLWIDEQAKAGAAVAAAIKQRKLELVRFSFADQHGVLRGKTLVNFFVEPSTRTRTTVEIAAKRTGVSERVATEGYDDTMPIFSRTGRFDPKALDVLASSFVEMKLLPARPDMAKLITEAYLPK